LTSTSSDGVRRPFAVGRVAAAMMVAALTTTLAACSGSSDAGGAASGSAAATTTPSPVDTGSGPVEGRTAAQILAAAQAAAATAQSVTVSGQANGAQVNARLSADNADSRILNAGHLVQLLRVDNAVYLRADDSFWTAQVSAAAAAKLHGKYVKLSPDQASGYSAFLGIQDFFTNTLKPQGSITKGKPATVAGHRVIPLTDTSDGSVLTISLEGPPYPVMIAKSGSDGGTITFTHWDQPVAVTAPPAAQVVDFTDIAGG
jgi:hypothetical protein